MQVRNSFHAPCYAIQIRYFTLTLYRAKGSRTLLASFIFRARYGEPPRSGWFANITVLYRSANFALEMFLSLPLSALIIGPWITLSPQSALLPVGSFLVRNRLWAVTWTHVESSVALENVEVPEDQLFPAGQKDWRLRIYYYEDPCNGRTSY